MERNIRLQAIQESRFLSLQSDTYREERPYIVPVHDPQGSIARSRYSKEIVASTSPASSLYEPSEASTLTDLALQKQATNPQKPSPKTPLPSIRYEHASGTIEHESVNPPPYISHRRWPVRDDSLRPLAPRISRRFSVTPSFMGIGFAVPNQDEDSNTDPRKIVSDQPGRISPMHVVELPGRFTDKPPAAKTIAWLQVLAGFFVVMDAQ